MLKFTRKSEFPYVNRRSVSMGIIKNIELHFQIDPAPVSCDSL